jgi:hypothetical protein
MKKLYSILFIVFIALSVRSEKIEYNFKYISTYADYAEYYNTQLNILSDRHSAKLFALTKEMPRPSILRPLLNSTVIIDTSIVGHFRKNGDYYIRTSSQSVNNLLCELKCSRDIYNNTNRNDKKHYLLAVKVNSIKSNERIVELDSIDNKSLFVSGGNDVALYGECLEAVELPFSMAFANE